MLEATSPRVAQGERAGQDSDEHLRRSGQHEIGIGRRAGSCSHDAVDGLDGQRLVVGSQLDRDRRTVRLLVREVKLRLQGEPVRAKRVLVVALGDQRFAPAPEG